LYLSERNSKGIFLDRVERDSLRRLENDKQLAQQCEEKYTFQPAISVKSSKLRSRSIQELSMGDYLKYEQSHRMLKHRTERELMESLTFTPELLKTNKHIKSTFTRAEEQDMSIIDIHKTNLSKLATQRSLEQKQREVSSSL
jgi:hypothetical protein